MHHGFELLGVAQFFLEFVGKYSKCELIVLHLMSGALVVLLKHLDSILPQPDEVFVVQVPRHFINSHMLTFVVWIVLSYGASVVGLVKIRDHIAPLVHNVVYLSLVALLYLFDLFAFLPCQLGRVDVVV